MPPDDGPIDTGPIDTGPIDTGPIDDELLNAVLDGEATPEERARVEGSAEGRRRLARLRATAEAVGEPVGSLDPATADRLVARALEVGPTPVTVPGASTPPDPTSMPSDELAGRRARRDRWRTVGRIAAAVAAIVVVVGGVTALARLAGRSSSDTASSSGDASSGAAAPQEAEAATSGTDASAATQTPPDLGVLPDADTVVLRYDQLLALTDTAGEHQFDSAVGAADTASRAADLAARTVCSVPPVAVVAGETWSVTAVAVLPTGPVLVMSNGLAPPATRLLVVDTQTCTVLVDRTR